MIHRLQQLIFSVPNFHQPRFNFRNINNIVDDIKHTGATFLNNADILLLLVTSKSGFFQ